MPKRGAKTLPPDLRRQLDKATAKIENVLGRLAAGDDPKVIAELRDVLAKPLDTAQRLNATARREASRSSVIERDVDFAMVTATTIRSLRLRSGLTQAELAEAMQQVGHDWKRITVAEIEAGAERMGEGRKVTVEELLALTCLFGVPLVAFLLPEPGDFVDAPTAGSLGVGGRLTAEAVRELVLGELGAIGPGGPDWELPRAVVLAGSVDDWRPARDFWEDRGPSRTEAEIQALEELVKKWREQQ